MIASENIGTRISPSILLFMVLGLISSCTYILPERRPEGKVIERSKQTRPVWADSPENQLVVNATEIKFHFAKYKQRDLPIAIKKSQIEAIEQTYFPWRPSFSERMRDYPKILAAKRSKNEGEYNELLEQVARKIHTQVAQIEDIYFERVQIDDATKVPELVGVDEYFDVHILVQLHPVENDRLKNVLYQVFSGAKSLELKKSVKDLAPVAPIKKRGRK